MMFTYVTCKKHHNHSQKRTLFFYQQKGLQMHIQNGKWIFTVKAKKSKFIDIITTKHTTFFFLHLARLWDDSQWLVPLLRNFKMSN